MIPATPEFHRPLPADRVPRTGLEQVVEADASECAALASRLGVPAVLALTCRFRLRAQADRAIQAEGRLQARVVRTCVVSLDDFESDVTEDFRVRFVPARPDLPDVEDPEELDPDSDDEIPFEGGTLDLGEAATEQLALALDPYPRKPGAEMPEEPGDATLSPFAALARLRRTD